MLVRSLIFIEALVSDLMYGREQSVCFFDIHMMLAILLFFLSQGLFGERHQMNDNNTTEVIHGSSISLCTR